jgi:hypothetical protein
MTFDEAMTYAKNCYEDVNVMLDETTGKHHVIREFAVEHWKQHYKNLAEIRIIPHVTLIVS